MCHGKSYLFPLAWALCLRRVYVCLRCEFIYMTTHGKLEARCLLSEASCSWQWCISLSLYQQFYSYSCILDTPSCKRTSSFVFQVYPTMDYLFNIFGMGVVETVIFRHVELQTLLFTFNTTCLILYVLQYDSLGLFPVSLAIVTLITRSL